MNQAEQKELSLELLWIAANKGLKSKPWSEVSAKNKARFSNIYDITIQAMEVSYEEGRHDAAIVQLENLVNKDFPAF